MKSLKHVLIMGILATADVMTQRFEESGVKERSYRMDMEKTPIN
jgi:hypothetical protein